MGGTRTARALHALLARVARAQGALELAIGDRVALLDRGDVNELGYARTRDFVREVLGFSPRLARDLAKLAEALWKTPLLRAAVHDGSLSREKAALVVKEAAKGHEAAWLALARRETVRGLRALLGDEAPPEDDPWSQLVLSMSPDEAATFLAALDMAGLVCEGGPTTPRWARVAAICQEFLGGRGGPIPETVPDDVGAAEYHAIELLARRQPRELARVMGGPREGAEEDPARAIAPGSLATEKTAAERAAAVALAAARAEARGAGAAEAEPRTAGASGEARVADRAPPDDAGAADVAPEEAALLAELEGELRLWTQLTALLAPPGPGVPGRPVQQLDRELRQLAPMYLGYDELVGRLCRMVQTRGTHRAAGHASYEACCADLLGVSTRTVRSTVSLAKKCEQMPELREALRTGELSREKARMIAYAASPADVAERIERAAPMTAIELRRELDGEVDRKMSGGEEVRLPVPKEVMELVDDVCDLVRERNGRWVPVGACLAIASLHCLGQWEAEARRNLRRAGPIRRRDRFLCQVPGCSGGADHVHHRRYRSHGGGNEPDNRISVCAPHHQRGFHHGNLRVEGSSPDGLRWWLGKEAVRRSRFEEPG